MNVLSLFDGISCGQLALQRAGIEVTNYFASETDKYCIEITNNNYPNTVQLGDVRCIDLHNLPKIDLLLAGSPCQGFSYCGNGLNFNDPRSKLFFEFVRVKNIVNPENWLLENVNMPIKWESVISHQLLTKPVKINSKLVSAQNRNRSYWSNLPIGQPADLKIPLSSILGDFDGIYVRPRGYNKGGIVKKDKCNTITSSCWEHNFFINKDGVNYKFTPEICEVLQTIPMGYTKGVSDRQRFKAIGNAWTVDVVAHIFRG